jgi:hypothetical protein
MPLATKDWLSETWRHTARWRNKRWPLVIVGAG